MNSVLRGNLSGIAALVMWSTMLGLTRSVTEAFGVAAGTALIYSVGAAVLFIKNGVPKIWKMPRMYVFGVGLLFIVYEIAFSQGVGMAENSRQTLEVGMFNYLWPCLTIVFSMWVNNTKLRWMVWPGTALSLVGLYWCVAANGNLDLAGFIDNLSETPLPYLFGLIAGTGWALYCNLSVRSSGGFNAVPFFFASVAVVLWCLFFLRGGELHFPGYWPLFQLLLIGVIVGVSYSLWENGIHQGNFILLAVCSYFSPAASMLFTSVWLQSMPPTEFWNGVALVVGGSILCWFSTLRKGQPLSLKAH